MFKQRHICIILSALFAFMLSMHSYAYYTAESVNISNRFNISRIVYIDFDAGSGTGDTPAASLALNADAVLPDNHFTKRGYHFAGWSLSSDGDILSDTAALIESSGSLTHITLHAIWAPNSYTVSFVDDEISGNTLPADTACTYDTATAVPSYSATADDKLFIGWSTAVDAVGSVIISPYGSLYNLSAEDNAQVTLYAQWEDESADVPEPNWNRHYDEDTDGNGTPDRLELSSGSTVFKDPSVKNHSSKDCYGYMAVYLPAVEAKLTGQDTAGVHDIARLDISSHWTLVCSSAALGAGEQSLYLYRYDTVLKAHGSSDISVNHTLRHADRSTDLMRSFTIQDFEAVPSGDYSIDVKAVLVEAIVTQSEADTMVKAQLGCS